MTGSAIVRVTVASDCRRVDLALPAAVPLAELVPDLARGVGLLEGTQVHGGYRILTTDGRRLHHDASLREQGLVDGALLTVVAGLDDEMARRYDDPAEAAADVLAERATPWPPAACRTLGVASAALLLLLALTARVLGGRTPGDVEGPAGAAAATAAILLGCAAALARPRRAPGAAVVLAWAGVAHAAVAGGLWSSGPPAEVVSAMGASALLAATVAAATLRQGRVALLPAGALAAAALVGGALLLHLAAEPASLASGVLAMTVATGLVVPRMAVVAAFEVRWVEGSGVEASPEAPVDAPALERDALLAHRLVVALEVSLGLLLVALSPLVTAAGPAGAALSLCCCGAVLLRARRYRASVLVLSCLVSGGAAAIGAIVATLLAQPGVGDLVAVALVVAALALCLALARGRPWHRAGDAAEACCLVALPPLALVAVGVPGRVAHLLGTVAG